MTKKYFFFFITLFYFSLSTGFAQSVSAAANPNADHDKMVALYLKSAEINLPDSVHTIFKNYAFNRRLPEGAVLKNEYLIKILYNKNISADEKIYACDFILKTNMEPDAYLPLFLVRSIQANLVSIKKSNN